MWYSPEHETSRRPARHNGFARGAVTRRFQPANGDAPPVYGGRSPGFIAAFLIAAALGGAALPFTFGDMFPRSFTATAVLGMERGEPVSAMAARLKETATLENVAAVLDLKREPLLAGGQPGAFAVATDLLTGTEKTASPLDAALSRRLSESLSLMLSREAGQLSLAVTTPDARLSVRIANAFADAGVNRAAAEAVDQAHGLTAAREAAERAERALADFTTRPNTGDRQEETRLSAEIAAHDAAISELEGTLAEAKDKSARIAALKIADISSGTAQFDFDAPLFDAAREKFVTAKLELDTLSAQLGPRHPRLLAAQKTVEEARTRLQEALRKLDTGAKERVKTVTRALDEAKATRATLQSPAEIAEDPDRLEVLTREAERLRADYLDRVDISRAAPPPASARILIAASEQTVIVNGPRPAVIAFTGGVFGLLLALGWLFVGPRLAGAARREDFAPEDDNAFETRDSRFARHEDRWDGEDDWRDENWREDDDWGPPPAHNDDLPLAERLREVLRRSAEMDYRETLRHGGDDRQAELETIRRRMAVLRNRVEAYNARRSGGR